MEGWAAPGCAKCAALQALRRHPGSEMGPGASGESTGLSTGGGDCCTFCRRASVTACTTSACSSSASHQVSASFAALHEASAGASQRQQNAAVDQCTRLWSMRYTNEESPAGAHQSAQRHWCSRWAHGTRHHGGSIAASYYPAAGGFSSPQSPPRPGGERRQSRHVTQSRFQ